MFHNYFRTALQNLLKYKLFSVINIVGLSIGLAACLLIILYVESETSYDKHWDKAERLYRVNTTLQETGVDRRTIAVTAAPVLPGLLQYFPDEIESGFQSGFSTNMEVAINDRTVLQDVYAVGPGFLDIFRLEVLSGSLESALNNPNSIALSEETALARFGGTDVLDAVITWKRPGGDVDLRVAAIYREPGGNSVLAMPALMQLDPAQTTGSWMGPFSWWAYVTLKEGVTPDQVAARLPAFTDQNVDITGLQAGPGVKASDRVGFELQNIQDIYLHSPFEGVSGNRSSTTTVLAFSAIAVLVLLVGCINFTVLSTSRATQRAREVAMRKTVGADRRQLVLQFLGESLLVVLIAIALALALSELLLPTFESLVGKELAISYSSPDVYLSMAGLWLAVSVIGGLYPAFVLSWFKPAAILKANRSAATPGSIGLRNTLVVFQFGISIALMIATAVIYVQVEYAMQRDPGYNTEGLLTVAGLQSRDPGIAANRATLQNQVNSLPAVTGSTLSGHKPMQRFGNSTFSFPFSTSDSETPRSISLLMVDHDFFGVYEIPLLAGRAFDATRDVPNTMMQFGQEFPPEERNSQIVLNSSAARSLGFADPQDAIGQQITTQSFRRQDYTYIVVGVVPDTQFFTLRSEGREEVYVLAPYSADVLTVRFRGDAQAVVNDITRIWSGITDRALQLGFVDTVLANEFSRERVEARMLISFSLLAILIACLGLYGSASFAVARRTKEIGIRKVMGADVREIVTLLMWQFSRPVLLANVIAWPAALWAMLTWLQRFPYRIDAVMLIPLCVAAGGLALSIAWMTVAGNTLRVASARPVLALRYE